MVFLFHFFKDFIYLFMRDTHREREREREMHRHRQRDKQAPCREPDTGLDARSPGSHSRLQAALNRCATGAAPYSFSCYCLMSFLFLCSLPFGKPLLANSRMGNACLVPYTNTCFWGGGARWRKSRVPKSPVPTKLPR